MVPMVKCGWLFIGIVIKVTILHNPVRLAGIAHIALLILTHTLATVAHPLTIVTLVLLMKSCLF